MSAWKEAQMALAKGDIERYEESMAEYAYECRMDDLYDREYCNSLARSLDDDSYDDFEE